MQLCFSSKTTWSTWARSTRPTSRAVSPFPPVLMPGNGYLYFNNGDVHEGIFEGGRAHGEGVLLTAKGDEYRGNGLHRFI